jgi:hypothetical protein
MLSEMFAHAWQEGNSTMVTIQQYDDDRTMVTIRQYDDDRTMVTIRQYDDDSTMVTIRQYDGLSPSYCRVSRSYCSIVTIVLLPLYCHHPTVVLSPLYCHISRFFVLRENALALTEHRSKHVIIFFSIAINKQITKNSPGESINKQVHCCIINCPTFYFIFHLVILMQGTPTIKS